MVAGGKGWVGGMGEGDQRVQTSRYEISKFWDVMYNVVTIVS